MRSFITTNPVGNRNNYSGTVGNKFTMTRDATVIALGRACSDAMSQSHRVALWNDADATMRGEVTINSSSPLGPDGIPYELLASPILLLSGSSYLVGTEEFSGGDQWRNNEAASHDSSIANLIEARYYPAYFKPTSNAGSADGLSYGHATFMIQDDDGSPMMLGACVF